MRNSLCSSFRVAALAVVAMAATPGVAWTKDLAIDDVFSMKPSEKWAVALTENEMKEMRGGLGLAFSVFWSASMENMITGAISNEAAALTPEQAFNSAVSAEDGAVSAFFGSLNGFNGIIQNIQAAGGSNNVFTNIMNIQLYLVTVPTSADIQTTLSTIMSRF
jgi:hypothetical protein